MRSYKLSDADKNTLELVALISGLELNQVKDVFKALLNVFTMDYLNPDREFDFETGEELCTFSIPYLFEVLVKATCSENHIKNNFFTNVVVVPQKPSIPLIAEIQAVLNGEVPPSEKETENHIETILKEVLLDG